MFEFNTIEEVVEDLRNGKIIVCTDDPDRENEGELYGMLCKRTYMHAYE